MSTNASQKKVKTEKKKKPIPSKINWGAIPVIKEEKARKKKFRKILEKTGGSYTSVSTRIVSGGGGPGTGKKR